MSLLLNQWFFSKFLGFIKSDLGTIFKSQVVINSLKTTRGAVVFYGWSDNNFTMLIQYLFL